MRRGAGWAHGRRLDGREQGRARSGVGALQAAGTAEQGRSRES